MSDEETVSMQDIGEEVTSGLLGNPNPHALFNGDFFKDNGPQVFHIRGFIKRQFTDRNTGKVETAFVLLFQEDVPGVKINQTREKQLYQIFGGAQVEGMINKPITVYYDPEVKFGNKKSGGIAFERAETLV